MNSNAPSALQMLQNLALSLPALQDLMISLAYILGISLIANGLYKLRNMGDHRYMMSQPTELKGPALSMFVGAMLLYLPSAFSTVTWTLWSQGGSGMMYYTPPTTSSAEFQAIVTVCFQIVAFVGLIAFVRGWLILAKLGDHSNQGGLGKALSHIIGGVLAYHIDATVYVVQATFGFT